jgi:NAD-dependent SIR2 family protein deacetylase
VFVCGAGVSRRIGMPLFRKLTEQIYADIGETPENEAAEEEVLKRGEYDRALRSLERRTHLPKAPSRISDCTHRSAVSTACGRHKSPLQRRPPVGG